MASRDEVLGKFESWFLSYPITPSPRQIQLKVEELFAELDPEARAEYEARIALGTL